MISNFVGFDIECIIIIIIIIITITMKVACQKLAAEQRGAFLVRYASEDSYFTISYVASNAHDKREIFHTRVVHNVRPTTILCYVVAYCLCFSKVRFYSLFYSCARRQQQNMLVAARYCNLVCSIIICCELCLFSR
jgi:hypothetical protein